MLRSQLNQIGTLSEEVIYALMAAGASIAADIASLGTAKIITYIVGAGCLVVLLTHWSEVESAWSQIVKAFKKAFKSYIVDSDVDNDFSIAKLRYQQDYHKMSEVRTRAVYGNPTASCGRHIAIDDAMPIIKRGIRVSLYMSHYESTALIVVSIPANTQAMVSRNLGTQYLEKRDISGGKLYVLYNTETGRYFHMHVSMFYDDTDYLREANGLCYQLMPTFSYDARYDHPRKPLNMPLHNNW